MSERLVEIEDRLEEIKKIQRPMWDEDRKLEKEKRQIHCDAVKEIALGVQWKLEYNKNRDCIYAEPVWEEDSDLSDRIYEYTSGYHSSFNLFKDEDNYDDSVWLHIDDGDVMIKFDTLEVFKEYSPMFDINTFDIEETINELQAKVDYLRSIIGDDDE